MQYLIIRIILIILIILITNNTNKTDSTNNYNNTHIDTNNINKDKYYEVAVALNKAKMEHWINIREISNEEQVKKLDSIWLNMKKRIEFRSQ